MASTNNFNSKRKRKASASQPSSSCSSSSSHSPPGTGNIMDGNTSQFIDYLSNVNNQTGMSEESLLLSPIFPSSKKSGDCGGTSPWVNKDLKFMTSSKVKVKRRRSSVMLLQQRRQEETSMEMMNQSDVLNSSPLVKSSSTRTVVTINSSKTASMDDENVGEIQNNVSEMHVLTSLGHSNESVNEIKSGNDSTEGEKVMTPHWKRALDASACPSLGLGSIGTEESSQSNEESLMLQSHRRINDDGNGENVHVDKSSIRTEKGQDEEEKEEEEEEKLVNDSCCHDDDKSATLKQQSCSKSDSGISFDSSLLDQSLEESLHDSMQGEEQDHNVENDFINDNNDCKREQEECNKSKDLSIQSNDAMEREDCCREKEPATSTSPHVSTRVTISPKQQAAQPIMAESTLKDADDVAVTPHSSSSNALVQDEEETASPSINKIRLGLTPRLKQLRAKLVRESMQGQQGDEYVSELDVTLNTTPTTGKENVPTAMYAENDLEIVASELSLTPALKSFRSKLLRDSLSIGEFDDNSIFCLRSQYDHYYPALNDRVTGIDATVSGTPFMAARNSEQNDKENVKPSNMPNYQEKRWGKEPKTYTSTHAPTSETKHVDELASPNLVRIYYGTQQQFLSPSLRHSTTTLATSTSSKGRSSKRVVFEDDLYLDQPIDLSSAKKNLNAQSSALVERLRGAAQKRMMSITRSRDSLAKKESMQELRITDANKNESNTFGHDANLDTMKHSACKTSSNKVDVCHDAKLSQEVPKRVGVPSIQKRPTTVPISPKLGLRREATKKVPTPTDNQTLSSSSTEKTRNNEPKSCCLRAKGSSTGKLTSAKRKPLTIPKSPLLGSRRKAKGNIPTTNPDSLFKMTHASPIDTLSKSSDPISPVGLEFLSRTPPCTDATKQDENVDVAPFTLHTQIRAKERAKYEACRILNEKMRNEAIQKERERLLREKYKELDSLKDKLR